MRNSILSLSLLTVFTLPLSAQAQDLPALEAAARKEGAIYSVGMPDGWANWKDTWTQLTEKYGLKHADTDMSSGEEIAKFANEGANATADIGDVGLEFGPIALARGVTQPYKTTTWDQVPDWAKDKDGHWVIGYTGTIAFLISADVKNPPASWADLLKGDYKVSLANVGSGAQDNAAVLAAAIAMGGGEENLQPGVDLFAKLAEKGRLLANGANPATMEKGEIQVAPMWDFNALNYRDVVGREKFKVVIPSDGSVTSGYATIINKFAKQPNAAKLAREYILSDAGQNNLAVGYARPIRIDRITLTPQAKERLLPSEQYAKARPINAAVWTQAAGKLVNLWRASVAPKM
ncbi:ABC transporter periplasmic substrate-binding protein [Agrobacterium tumefaciens F2]|jgi:putative spermidine/putrescine transport system substrate-binding protein|uniref:ABC transporter substrate-binding protein n=1 Tax=Rhizobium sp. TaxID=391 RepID=UPI0002170127|nr:ABC transporter periplasmic substrate-binding protein [Agrobacterium tumefaciens F2]HCD82282.1 ABC transporter substrate-binding protein [Agrobacterium sp.]